MSEFQAEPIWTYWCPPEGEHMTFPQELQVGIVSVDDTGMGHPLTIAAVIPPTRRKDYDTQEWAWFQNEAFARVTCEAMKAEDWNAPDGFAAGLSADGAGVPFPRELPHPDSEVPR